jgi:predicted nucleotide-binding protein
MRRQPFQILGIIVEPSNVTRICIFKSEKKYGDLRSKRGESLIGKDNAWIVYQIQNGYVDGIFDVTPQFITFTQEEKKRMEKPMKEVIEEKQKIFIVHGRDETQALRLQKHLTKTLELDAEMFEDFKERSSSNTIIEQLEYIRDSVGYAFVIVTPDDLGCLREEIDKCRTTMLVGKKNITVKSVCDILDNLNTRARQNVVFEHGLFIGALGRDRVCCLLQRDTKEKPTDIDGILYVDFDKSVRDTFPEITEKLRKLDLIKT